MRKFLFLLVALHLAIPASIAQNQSHEELFQEARKMAFSKDYQSAISLLHTLQQAEPKNTDYSIFLARVYGWNKEYDKAISTLDEIIHKVPFPQEALEVMVTTQLWAENYEKALNYSNIGIERFNDPSFTISKARALMALNKPKEARQLLNQLPAESKNDSTVLSLHTQLLQKTRHSIAIAYTNTSFSSPAAGPWHSAWAYYKTTVLRVPVLAKYQFGSMGDRTGSQIDLEVYPKTGPSGYLYLNAGMSLANEVFPDLKFGAEYFHTLNERVVLSAGSRLLRFENNNVYLLTGHMGYHFTKNTQIRYRPFAALSEDQWNFTHTAALTFLNPLKESNWTLHLQYGSIPYEYITETAFSNLETFRIGLEHQWRVSENMLLKPVFLYELEEYLPSEYKNRFNVQLMATFRF